MSDKQLEIDIRHTLNTASGILPMDISMSVPAGAILAITGPSGSGKTTLLRQIAGLVKPQSGCIRFGNKIWFDHASKLVLPIQERNIGFVFQDYALFPHLSVRQNLLYALDKGQDQADADALLEAIEMKQLSDRKPHQLSGGQQQRVALARALVRKPEVLLLDEPLSAIDSTMRGNLQDLLLKFHREYGFTMILVTHDLAEIFRLSDQVVLLDHGQIQHQGTPAQVYTPTQEVKHAVTVYGEVVSVTIQADHLLVSAWIDHKIHTFTIPVNHATNLKPGDSFTIPYRLDIDKITIFDK